MVVLTPGTGKTEVTVTERCLGWTRDAPARRPRVLAAAVAAALALVVGLPGAAAAHAGLVSSNPGDGARLRVNPGSVTLRFNETIPTDLARVVLVAADGSDDPQVLPVTAAGATGVRATLSGRETGALRLSYRVTSADGHPIAGEVAFAVSQPAAGSARGSRRPAEQGAVGQDRTGRSDPSAVTPQDARDPGGDVPSGTPWLLAVGAVLVLAVPVAVATLLRRASRGRRP